MLLVIGLVRLLLAFAIQIFKSLGEDVGMFSQCISKAYGVSIGGFEKMLEFSFMALRCGDVVEQCCASFGVEVLECVVLLVSGVALALDDDAVSPLPAFGGVGLKLACGG